MPTSAAVDSPFTLHLSSAHAIGAGLLESLARPLVGSHVVRVLETLPDDDAPGAAARLAQLVALFGWGQLDAGRLEACGMADVTAADRAAAQALGGTLGLVVFGERDDDGVTAFVGPACQPRRAALADSDDRAQAIRVDARQRRFTPEPVTGLFLAPRPPRTPWLVRLAFPGVVPHAETIGAIASASGLCVKRVTGHDQERRWLLVGAQPREEVDTAVARLSHTHRIRAAAWRRLDDVYNIS